MLAVRASRKQIVLGPLRQVGERGQELAELAQEDLVGAANLEKEAGLRDVLSRGAPVHVPTGVALARAVQRPDERDDGMAGLRQSRAHGVEVQVFQVRLVDDLAGSVFRDDAELGLRLRQRRLHVEPRLEARSLGEEGPHARILDAERGRLLKHARSPESRRGGPRVVALSHLTLWYGRSSGACAKPSTPDAAPSLSHRTRL